MVQLLKNFPAFYGTRRYYNRPYNINYKDAKTEEELEKDEMNM
jgi:hypothetical protein